MSLLSILGTVFVALLLVYLIYVLLNAEEF
ncbi:potassium-transporting ATPase subunit F [Providencia vermicola]|uniref:Potassium-transporting ATPase subunit F n=1 Tax=Providencia stuartii TaxID=588 RepID=A0AAI9MXD2_PROST|nr:potassium-transporting ATPase subunit F [Providencia stuartii]ELR5045844.1 potassium-transporting ATPase subunit F [Providencia rettgeri]MTB41116.1 potassium-transporting ATPase subunit F [Providencia sp. wls1949]MTC07012.1 potassium-transporting ATPase subunit F [Providencia sp. wls1948]QIC16915.1 potassium-transporting ATPase subunit F [Providencia vermicola]